MVLPVRLKVNRSTFTIFNLITAGFGDRSKSRNCFFFLNCMNKTIICQISCLKMYAFFQ